MVFQTYTCLAIFPREKSLTFTFALFDIVTPVPRTIFRAQVCDIEFIGDATVSPLKPFVTDTLAEGTDPMT